VANPVGPGMALLWHADAVAQCAKKPVESLHAESGSRCSTYARIRRQLCRVSFMFHYRCLRNLLPGLRLTRGQTTETFWKDVVRQMDR